ncbi:hypothetical protein PEP31012_04642 [Pandoraea eparura]|uniref:Uncharacterized protein n=2 Tax=Pandoraea eparura TaxID=2508291 RepID=A0A5E4YPF4_9BURK|nr:hypothetical protein PEP31012_04642 [Pandoraea eparura]
MDINSTQALLSDLWPAIGGVLGGAATIVVAIKGFGGKILDGWIDNRFKTSLQRVQNEHEKAIAHLKMEIDSVLAARVKVQEKQFGIVATAWEKFSEMFVAVASALTPVQTCL